MASRKISATAQSMTDRPRVSTDPELTEPLSSGAPSPDGLDGQVSPVPPAAEEATEPRTGSLPIWVGGVLLIAMGIVAYYNSFDGAFILDDVRAIRDNPSIRRLWPVWHAMVAPPNSGITSRPVVSLSLAVSHAMTGLGVRGYHVVNLVTHLLAALALYGIVRRMLESDKLRDRYGSAAPGLAMVAAAIWVVHPLQTESVTYIIQRAESLMGLFFLLTLYCSIRGFQSPHPAWWYLAAIVACALGMGTKEVMVSAPLLVLLYDRLFVPGSLQELVRRRWGLYVGLAGTWLILAAVLGLMRVEQQLVLVKDLTPGRYAMTQFGVIVHYLRLSYWPHPLVLDYLWPVATGFFSVLPWATVVLALMAATAWALLRGHWAGFWGAWFFLILAPTSSVLPIGDVIFEHRMYLPLAAVVVLSVVGGYELLGWACHRFGLSKDVGRWGAICLVVLLIVVLGSLTIERNEDYQSQFSVYRDVVLKRPDNARAQNNLGIELNKLGRTAEAENHFAAAVRLKPDSAEAQGNLGMALLRRGQIDQAATHLSEAVRLKPELWEPHFALGVALKERGDVQRAIAEFVRALELKPNHAESRAQLSEALIKAGKSPEAVAKLGASGSPKPSSPRAPSSPQAHYELGNTLYLQGKMAEAIGEYSDAIRLNPRFAEAYNNLALAVLAQGDVDGAIKHLSTARRLKPDYAKAALNLGTILYRQGRVKEAIDYFNEAARLDPSLERVRDEVLAQVAESKAAEGQADEVKAGEGKTGEIKAGEGKANSGGKASEGKAGQGKAGAKP